MKLIVGLGNPGIIYKNTRHNVGFLVIDEFCKKNNITLNEKKFNGIYSSTTINNDKIILLKPLNYINLSGEVIKSYINYFKIDIDDLLIIHDDMDTEVGNFKLKLSGSSAGHNGLKSIEQNIKTQDYRRLKIGISKDTNSDRKSYVLGCFTKEEKVKIKEIVKLSNNIILDYIEFDFNKLMNKYNKKQ